jgi:hypothetical protein
MTISPMIPMPVPNASSGSNNVTPSIVDPLQRSCPVAAVAQTHTPAPDAQLLRARLGATRAGSFGIFG